MTDPRIQRLAEVILDYSVKLQKEEKVLIEGRGIQSFPLIDELIRQVYLRGAFPYISVQDNRLRRTFLMQSSEEHLRVMADYERYRMQLMDAWIGIMSPENITELSDVPDAAMNAYSKAFVGPVHLEERVKNTKWVLLAYPNNGIAQSAGISLERFEDYYFDVCTIEYSALSAAMDPLVSIMEKTDRVRITGKDTDLTFSIQGIPSIKCDGIVNLPDGEVFTAPVRDSVNGHISFNCPAMQNGRIFENIEFQIKDGKVTHASANNTEGLNSILDTDEGARYFGEFAFGLNPMMTVPIKDTLFDEKIAGSIHLALGQAGDETDNGNISSIHWDLVFLQTPEFGGGDIYFDGRLIRKNGLFILPELESLNPR